MKYGNCNGMLFGKKRLYFCSCISGADHRMSLSQLYQFKILKYQYVFGLRCIKTKVVQLLFIFLLKKSHPA